MSSYCQRCDRSFGDHRSLGQHIDNSGWHHVCPCCPADFTHRADLAEHLITQHSVCDCCGSYFSDETACREHMYAEHHYCKPCRRDFDNAHNLRVHLKSAQHIGRTVKCVCQHTFPTVSAVCLHIEEGACPDVTEHLLNHLLSLMSRRYGFMVSDLRGPFFNDPSGTMDRWIVEVGFNIKNSVGSLYQCFCCGCSFDRRTTFIRHLYGPLEAEIKSGWLCAFCDTWFDRPSGLMQHRESGSCPKPG